MSDYLIELAFGPVQGFIAAARRSRDLWGGSYILSEVARAAGGALIGSGAELIYPVAERVRDKTGSNLSNVLLAKLADSDAAGASAIAARAIEAGREQLRDFSRETLEAWQNIDGLRIDLWQKQVEDALEAYSAWAEIGADGYRPAYERLKKAFAARKNTRDFRQMDAATEPGIPKSSLDGLRESVLPKDRKVFPARFGLRKGEQLDALGAIKRDVGRAERFTALPRIAADPWLQRIAEKALERLKQLEQAYAPLVARDLASRATGNEGTYGVFPYDAALLYPERLEGAMQEADDESCKLLEALRNVLRGLWKDYGRPCPYVALLVADGDRMGKFVDAAKDAAAHTAVSRAVAAFADLVPELARQVRGHSVFNGGEDLTVMLPLPGVVAGAKALADAFAEEIAKVDAARLKEDGDGKRPTLRAGVAICHVLEPLGRIRGHAEDAEKFAKGEAGRDEQGNALGLKLHIRAGHEVGCRIGFLDQAGFDALDNWQNAYREGRFPGRLAYDLRDIGRDAERWGHTDAVAMAEFNRLLIKARESGGDGTLSDDDKQALRERLQALVNALGNDIEALKTLGDELILARWLAARSAADVGERT